MIDLSAYTLAFLDVETTGLSPRSGDRVCEIAVALYRGDEIEDSFQSLVNPMRRISPGASRVNGITDADVSDAPRFHEIADRIEGLIANATIVCHNAQFDLGFVDSEFARLGKELHAYQVIDTLSIARNFFFFASNSLQAIASELNITTASAHRAMADVQTTHAVFSHFMRELGRDGEGQLEDLMSSRHHWSVVTAANQPHRTPSPGHRTFATASGRPHVLPPRKLWPVVAGNDPPVVPPEIHEAVRTGAQLNITYVDSLGNYSQRLITAREVVDIFGRVYLVAHCHLRNDERNFRLDRIVKISSG